jgi:hypothetical protein
MLIVIWGVDGFQWSEKNFRMGEFHISSIAPLLGQLPRTLFENSQTIYRGKLYFACAALTPQSRPWTVRPLAFWKGNPSKI